MTRGWIYLLQAILMGFFTIMQSLLCIMNYPPSIPFPETAI